MSSAFVWDILFYILPFVNLPGSLVGWQCVPGLCHLSETWLKLPIRGIKKDKYQEPYMACSRSRRQLGAESRLEAGTVDSEFCLLWFTTVVNFFSNLLFLIRCHKFTTDCPQGSPYNLSFFIPFRMSWFSVCVQIYLHVTMVFQICHKYN